MDLSFLTKVTNCNPRQTPEASVKQINEIVALEDFDPEVVEESASAAKYLCAWCQAMNKYLLNYQRLKPKIIYLEDIKAGFASKKDRLERLEDELNNLTRQLAERNEKRNEAEQAKQELITKRAKLQAKILHTMSLVDYLRSHHSNWEDRLKNLESRAAIIKGNSLLSAASIEYLGMFEGGQRTQLMDSWKRVLGQLGIKSSADFKLYKFLGNKLDIYTWQLAGLPPSLANLENAMILQFNNKAKVVYDPNDTCLQWMRKLSGKDRKEVLVTSVADPKISQKMQTCLEKGQTLIIDFFNGNLSGLVSGLLTPTIRVIEGQKTIKIDDMWYNFNPKFDFYLITRDKSVVLLPDVQGKCCIVKFCLDDEGLAQSLRSLVTRIFNPEQERERFELNTTSLEKKKVILDNQEKILQRLVVNTDESLLEDEEYLDMLTTYASLTSRLEKEIETEKNKQMKEDLDSIVFDRVVSSLLECYKTIGRFSEAERFLQLSANNFEKTVQKIVSSLGLDSLASFNKENTFDMVAKIFNVISGAAKPETKLFMRVDLCVSILKIYNEFRQDIWDYIITPKNKRQGGEAEQLGIDLEPSVWQALRNLRQLIPSLELEHLPVLVSTFQNIPKLGLQAAIKETITKTEQLTSLERLALSISFLPDNFHLCLEIFTEDVLPGINDPSPTIEECLKACDFDQPLVYILPGSCDFSSMMSRINSTLKTNSSMLFCGNATWEKLRMVLEKAVAVGNVVVLCEFNLCPQLHESTSRYMREIHSKHKVEPGFRLVITVPPDDQMTTVELISMSVKLLDREDSTILAHLPAYYSAINFEKVKFASVKLQNIVLNTVLAYFIVVNRAKYGNEGSLRLRRLCGVCQVHRHGPAQPLYIFVRDG